MNQLTGFGVLAEGQSTRQGQLVLATRGTNFSTNKFDLATDANIGMGIVHGMLRFLGRGVVKVQNVTISFMMWVLNTFVNEISGRALQAMERVIRGNLR